MKAAGIATLALALPTAALCGEFFEKDGLAIRGYDPVAYFTAGKAAKGSPDYSTSYKGSVFRFESAANREAFKADPVRYAPQYGGFCAFGLAGGYKAAIDPNAFKVVEGKLYLNYNAKVQSQWNADIPGYVRKADANWPGVMRQAKVIE